MITFAISDEQQAIAETLASYARDELAPIARDCDEAGTLQPQLLQASWDLGILANSLPEAVGGGGDHSALTNAIALEELSYGCASITAAAMAPGAFALALTDGGSADQQKTYLPPFAGSEFHAASLAYHESAWHFSPNTMETTAQWQNGQWVINGLKRMVPLAESSQVYLVIARTPDADRTPDTESTPLKAFIVPRDAKGVSVTAESGQMGLKPVPMGMLTLDNVGLSAVHLLGNEQQGAGYDVRRLLSALRVGGAAMALGVARAATDYAIPYAKERVAFGEPIGKKQSIAFMLADMHSNCEALRWLIWKAASQLDAGENATRASVLAYDYAQRHGVKTVDDALQVFGGHGFIRDFPLEMWLRNVRTLTLHQAIAAV